MALNSPPATDLGILRSIAALGLQHFDVTRFNTEEAAAIQAGVAACICSVFRYLENQLTVFPGAGIAGKFYRQKYRQKVSLGGERSKLWRSNNSVSSRTCARRR